ncbi:MAG: hydrogenase maturation protease, partial [Candidatus Korarchaeum sp.]|nr:hydrogenase maturation protease [Candidatus Korarchaeum sp.]MDW8035284.1 hydrogenase maturation protease [Candidatus Korarchaeum sp.]
KIEELKTILENTLDERTLLLCVGNELRGDDAVGVYIGRELQSRNFSDIIVTSNPENYMDVIRKRSPEKIIIIDAVDFGERPGSIVFTELREFPQTISSHRIQFSKIIKFLGVDKAYILGIQPKKLGFSEEITPEVRRSADIIISLLSEVIRSRRD